MASFFQNGHPARETSGGLVASFRQSSPQFCHFISFIPYHFANGDRLDDH